MTQAPKPGTLVPFLSENRSRPPGPFWASVPRSSESRPTPTASKEAHLTTKAGDQVIVQVDKPFSVTGTQTGGSHGDRDRADRIPSSAR
jgi:hypothetical protein